MKRYLIILGVLALLTALALPAHAHNSILAPTSNTGGVLPGLGDNGR